MSAHSDATFELFLERHIILREEWLDSCLRFLESQNASKNLPAHSVARLVYEQWLHSDLKDTSHPSLEQIGIDLKAKGTTLPGPLILQVTSAVDISRPAQQQLTDLQPGPIHKVAQKKFFPKKENLDEGEYVTGRRCLLLDASDGSKNVKLVEHKSLSTFPSAVPPGAKVLLLPNLEYRRGIFLLNPKLCQFLGGDCEKFKDNLADGALRKRIEYLKIENEVAEAGAGGRGKVVAKMRVDLGEDSPMSSPGKPPAAPDDDWDDDPVPNAPAAPVIFVEDSLDAPASTLGGTSRPPPICAAIVDGASAQTPVRDVTNINELPPTPSPIKRHGPASVTRLENARVLFKGPNVKRHRLEPPMLAHGQLIVPDDSIQLGPPPKSLSEAMTLMEQQQQRRSLQSQARQQTASTHSPQTPSTSSSSHRRAGTESGDDDDPVVKAYRDLRIAFIAEVQQQMRFAIGSVKRNVQAFVKSVIEPLRIVDGAWTQTIAIEDPSTSSADLVKCIIAGDVLHSLIGISPEEAAEIKRSADLNRRAQGKARIEALAEALNRLDLIMEIEFFARRDVLPIIRDIRTMTQRLNVF